MLPAGIVDGLPEEVPEVQELAVQFLDPLELLVAELCQRVSPCWTHFYHPHVRNAGQNFLNFTESFPQLWTVDDMFLLDDLNTVVRDVMNPTSKPLPVSQLETCACSEHSSSI